MLNYLKWLAPRTAPDFFCRDNVLISRLKDYAASTFESKKLCILSKIIENIFESTHDGNGHIWFAQCYERISNVYYIRNLSGHLQDYSKPCPQCQIHQTKRYKFYGNLQPILSPPIPFHTIIMDFMLAFPKNLSGLDCALTIICKFSKRATVIPGKIIWFGSQWAVALLKRLNIGDWGLPKIIISNRDRKFLSELWSTLFFK